jgi:hypothetical protein
MRLVLVLGIVVALAIVAVTDAAGTRFTDAPCPEAGPGGIRVCPGGAVGTPYRIKLDGSGGCGPALPYAFAVLGGMVPPGLALQRDGLISGTPTVAGNWSFWLQLSDEDPPSASWCIPKKSEREFSLHVDPPPATVGLSYWVGVAAPGDGPQTWSLASGQLPAGLALDSGTGTISGIPKLPGPFGFGLSAVDSRGRRTSVELTIVVAPKLAILTTHLAASRVGRPYRANVRTTGGVRPVKLKVQSGRLPHGMRLNVGTGVLSGKPRTAGIYRITLAARDALGATATRTFALTVRRARPRAERRTAPHLLRSCERAHRSDSARTAA